MSKSSSRKNSNSLKQEAPEQQNSTRDKRPNHVKPNSSSNAFLSYIVIGSLVVGALAIAIAMVQQWDDLSEYIFQYIETLVFKADSPFAFIFQRSRIDDDDDNTGSMRARNVVPGALAGSHLNSGILVAYYLTKAAAANAASSSTGFFLPASYCQEEVASKSSTGSQLLWVEELSNAEVSAFTRDLESTHQSENIRKMLGKSPSSSLLDDLITAGHCWRADSTGKMAFNLLKRVKQPSSSSKSAGNPKSTAISFTRFMRNWKATPGKKSNNNNSKNPFSWLIESKSTGNDWRDTIFLNRHKPWRAYRQGVCIPRDRSDSHMGGRTSLYLCRSSYVKMMIFRSRKACLSFLELEDQREKLEEGINGDDDEETENRIQKLEEQLEKSIELDHDYSFQNYRRFCI